MTPKSTAAQPTDQAVVVVEPVEAAHRAGKRLLQTGTVIVVAVVVVVAAVAAAAAAAAAGHSHQIANLLVVVEVAVVTAQIPQINHLGVSAV